MAHIVGKYTTTNGALTLNASGAFIYASVTAGVARYARAHQRPVKNR
jgi:hypothetical protein